MHTNSDEKTTESWMKEAQKGYMRVAVLMLLSNKPAHGYEIMKEIKDRTQGFYKPTPGGVYPILRDLEKDSYIKGQWHKQNNRNVKTYRITEKGTIILRKTVIKQNEIANNMNTLFQEFAREVLNVELKNPMPMPNPFLAFREVQNIEELEKEKNHLKEHIQMMQEKIRIIDKVIATQKSKATSQNKETS
jgi:DNA-binding PadR family transcriptional regulator